MSGRVTIKDIAREVGVSAITVSKALNDKPQVSDAMRERIIQVAKEMHYVPNASAKSLIRKEKVIATVCPREPHEFYSFVSEGLHRAEEELMDCKCRVRYYSFPSLDSETEVRDCIRQALADGMDGLVLTSNHRYEVYRPELEQVLAAGIPVLYNTICGELLPGVVGAVRLNAALAGAVAADFHGLFLRGLPAECRKTAIFVGNRNVTTHMECVKGYRDNTAAYGLELTGIYETNESRRTAYNLTGQVLAQEPGLQAIYISSYNSAGVCEWLRDHGMQDRVIVVGHDLYPALARELDSGTLKATLFQNQFEYGRESVHRIFEYLIGERSAESCTKLMLPNLVTRGMLPYYPHYVKDAFAEARA